jgi:hypothetical protein
MARSSSEKAIVDFILKSIRTRSTNEILDYHSKMDINLLEMIRSGLQPTQLNSLPESFIADCLGRGEVSEQELIDAGWEKREKENTPILNFGIDHSNHEDIIDVNFGDDDFFESGLSSMTKDQLLDAIRSNKAFIPDVQAGLSKKVISINDLLSLGYSHDLIERMQQFEPQNPVFPSINDLPPLRLDASDVYFLGMPGSGKSTMLASLFSYCNDIGVMRNIVDSQFGNQYRNQLVLGMVQGFLPSSTPTEFVNFIPVDMKYSEEDGYQKLNFIDMAGEKFRRVAQSGMNEFKKYQEYLNNQNPKCLIFVIDYFHNNRVETTKQDQNLQEVLALLENFGILKNTEAVYLVVTKADLFPEDDKQAYADKYIDLRYRNFLNACKDAKDKFNFSLKSFAFSIGPTSFNYILQDCNPETNLNLVNYPEQLLEQLAEDLVYNKDGRGGKWFRF